MVTVINGVNELNVEGHEGNTVAEVRAKVASAMGVDPAAAARVNGEAVPSSHELVDGDVLEFVKVSGSKASN